MVNYTGNKERPNFKYKTGKHSIHSIHKTAVLGTSHVIQIVLQTET